MKYLILVLGTWVIMQKGFAQLPTLLLSTDKTVSLVFPFSIKHVDRGTGDVLVQAVKEEDNILLVKAGRKDFVPTNISIITSDGAVYCFAVLFDPHPSTFIYQVPNQNKRSVGETVKNILDYPFFLHRKTKSGEINITLRGIYNQDQTSYFQISLENNNSLEYPIGFINLEVWDLKKIKRTASQQKIWTPVAIAGNTKIIKAHQQNSVVLAYDQLVIQPHQYLVLEVSRQNGGPGIFLKIPYRVFHKAHFISGTR